MMNFKLNGPVGADFNHDPDDVKNAKQALNDLGFFKTPKYGMTPYPDQPLFDGIRGFQKAHGLKVDGIMKPGGETERIMGQATRQQAQAAPNRSGDHVPIDHTVRDPKTGKTRIWNGRGWDDELTVDDINKIYGPDSVLRRIGRMPTEDEDARRIRRRDRMGPAFP